MKQERPQTISAALVVTATLCGAALLLAQSADVAPPATQPALPAVTAPDAQLAAREALLSGLVGSKHDFTHGERFGRDMCLPCHTPHVLGVPLPRLDRRPPELQPLRPYESADTELTGWTLLCLGCHDGVTAPDVYSSAHAVTVSSQLGNSRLGTRGLRSHPIGIVYPTRRDEYQPPAAVEAAGLRLPEGRIQCTTCHDAHNTHGHAGMLLISNDRSALCLACHRI